MVDSIDLSVDDLSADVETMSDANALGCFSTLSTLSSSGSTYASASTVGSLG